MRLKHFLSVFLTLLTLSVGQMWGASTSFAWSSGSYANSKITWTFTDVCTIVQEQNGAQTAPNSSYVSAPRWYSGNKLTFTAASGVSTFNSITITATSDSYATALANSTYTVTGGTGSISKSASNSVVTISMTGTVTAFTIVMGGQSRLSNTNAGKPTFDYSVAATCSNKVALTKGSTTNGTFDLDKSNGSYDNCDANFVVHVSNIVPANNAQYCNGIEATGGNSSVTGPVDGVWTVTYTKGNNITSVITPTYANKTTASISFVNAGTPAPSTSGYVGDSYTLPSTNNYNCNGKTFVGWSTVEVDETNTKPLSNFYEPGANVTLVASQTFYAVFAEQSGSGTASYKLIESAPSSWDGDYLIVYNNTNAMNTHYGNADANTYATYADISSHYTSSTKSIAANNTTNAYAYTVVSSTNGHTIKRKAATEYLGYNSSSNGAYLRWDGSITANQNEWTLGVGSIVSVYNSAKAIRWNDSSPRFAIYATDGQSAIQLFKYDPGVSYSAYSTDCSSAACENPTIGTQPATSTSYAKNAGSVTALSVAATGTGTLTYQWYSNTTASNDGGTPISGATNASYTPSVDAVGTKFYYCVVGVQGQACSTTSNVATINVTQTITGISLNKDNTTLEIGDTETLTATIAPNDATEEAVWVSSNTNIATVEDGVVTAVAAGSATITCKSPTDNTIKGECAVTVTPAPEYKKVTAALTDWSGEYLLVYEPGESKARVWTGVDATSCYAEVDIPENGKIAKPATGVKLVLDALTGDDDGKYSIKIVGGDNNGKYLDEFNTSNANIKFTENAVPAEVSYDGENNSTQFTTGNKYMRYNNAVDQKRFRGYASNGQSAVQLYRKVVTAAVTITAPAEGTGSLALANGQTPVASGENIEAGTELTVTATPSAQNHYIGGTVTVTKTVGGDDVTEQVYNSTTGKITMPEYAITVSVTFTPTYAIVSASVTGGSFSWEETTGHTTPAYAAAGTQIQASANATDGYVFGGTFDIYQTGATSTKVSHTNGLFTMPAYAVTIGGTFNVAPTITLSQTSTMAFTKVATGASTSAKFTVSAANLTAGSLSVVKSGTNPDKFGLSVSSITVTAGSVSNAEVTVTPVTTATGDYTATITVDDGEGGAAAQSFNVTLHVEDQYTINWYVNGTAEANKVKTQTDFANEDLDIPTASDLTPFTDCSQFVFLGWKDGSAIDGGSSTSAPSLANVGTKVAASKNYYAVFGDGSPAVDESDSWDLESESDDWTGNNTETYFSKPYGIKKANAYIVNSSISDFENYANGADEISITVTCFQNSGSTSRLTVYLVDEDGAIIAGTGKEFTPANGSQVSDATDAEVTYNASELSDKDATGYMVKCTTYGKNILITGTAYEITKDENYTKYYTTCPQIKNVVLSAATVDNGSISFKVGGKAATSARTESGDVEVDIVANPDPGYELTGISLSSLSGATYNSTTGKIELAQNTNGSLTVTATFSQKNYEVIVEEYPVIGATLTGATTTAHYNDEITISTNEPAGYKFSGWCMYEVTDIERETDIADEFFTGDYDEYEYATTAKFKMPNRSIVAEANFKKVYSVDEFMDADFTKTNNNWYYVTGLIAEVPAELYSGTKMTYVISDNATKSGLFLTLYRGLGEDGENFSAVSDLAVGDKVVVYGQWSSSYKNLNEGNYILKDCLTKKALSALTIAGDASVTTYDVGDSFDKTGLSLTATYNTGYVIANYTGTAITSDYDAPTTFTAGVTKVTVSAEEGLISTSRDIPVTVSSAVLDHVEISAAAQTEFWAKEQYKEPLLDAYLTDEPATILHNVTGESNTTGLNMSEPGNKSVTVTYTRKAGQSDDVEYNFTVKPVVVDEAHAHSVATARAIIDVDNAEGEDLELADESAKTHVIGVVTSVNALTGANAGKYTIVIKDQDDASKEMTLYQVTLKSGITNVEAGDVIKAYGNLYYHSQSSKYEINTGGQVVWKQPKVELSFANKTMEVGENWTISGTVTPAEAPVTFSIKAGSDECIALNGDEITATAVGTATIVVTAEDYNEYLGNSKEFTVTVSPAKVHTDVIILAEYNGHYYALNNTAGTTEVQFENGMVIVPDQATKTAILWDRAEREGVATFYNAKASKFLNGGTSTTLGVATEEGTYTSWTWVETETKAYYTSNSGASARTFMYMNGQTIKNYAASNIGNGSYAQANVYTGAVAVKISSNTDVSDLPENASVLVEEGVTLTVDAASTLDNLIVEAGGKVELAANKLTVVGTFSIETTMAGGNSGQLEGATASNFAAGEAYIDITLGAGGTNQQWHAFTVPFPVDVMNGIYDLDGNKLTNEVNYAIMEYHGDLRAKGEYGWKKIRTTLVPGTFYIMATDDRTTYRFKKKAGEAIVAGSSKTVYQYPLNGGSTGDNGWNGVGNPTLRYGKVDAVAYVLNPESYEYEDKDPNSTNFVVGTPFFVVATADGSISMGEANASAAYAPRRSPAKGIENIKVAFGNEECTDYLTISASEDALNEYETGKDYLKMMMSSTPKVARIFSKAYGVKLCREFAPMVNDQAEVALELYAPQAGTYTISVPAEREDASLYLTKDGNIIWDLTMSPYEAEFDKGATEGYGLMLVRKAPQVTTGVENVQGDKTQCTKVILNDHVYILRDAQLYDVTGKAVK